MAASTYRRVVLTIDGLEMDIEVPAAASLRLRWADGEPQVGQLVKIIDTETGIRQFAKRLGIGMTYPQKFAAGAHYLREYEKLTTVTVHDLVDACSRAGWGLTRNGRREAENARHAGLLAPFGSGRYQLSPNGERYVQERLERSSNALQTV